MVRQGYVGSVAQCRNLSTVCVKMFADPSLSFVYVDARHDRKGVLEDLQAFRPKLREGGVMAGHDYTVQDEPAPFQDPAMSGQDWTLNFDGTRDASGRVVKGALDDFFSGVAAESPSDLKLCPRPISVTYRESAWNTWAVRK
mmetsp:Transcript_57901/g.188253  ORF Transcript_57901/g.188253 Transcript_57901/m.188253 type:complete len:142 (+) Transcript_57901:441-866(+)